MSQDQNPYEWYERATVAIQALRLSKGDAVVFHFPENIDPNQMEMVSELMRGAERDMGVSILCVRQGIKVEHFPKEIMNKAGWYQLTGHLGDD